MIVQTYDKILLDSGVKNCGTLKFSYGTDYNAWSDTWRKTGGNPPSTVLAFSLIGLDITSQIQPAITLAKNNLGTVERAYLFTLRNGAVFHIDIQYISPTSQNYSIIAIKNGVEYLMGSNAGYINWLSGSLTKMCICIAFTNVPANPYVIALLDEHFFSGNDWYRAEYLSAQYAENWNIVLDKQILEPNDPYITNDNQTPDGGYGPYDYTSETETPPQLPALSAAQVGFVSLWNPTQSEMQDLANYLWTGTFDLTNFKKLFTDPMECVLSVGIIPITPTREATKREIVFGGSSHSGVNAYAVTEQFYIVDMGTLHITGMSQGALDYSPYAKASIYLPYCGTYALDVDEIMDSDISLEYHVDIYTGACVAYLTIDGHLNSDGKNVNAIMYQFTGNVLASIPITGNDHSQFIQSMLFMGAAAAATVATSGAGAGAAAGAGADLGAETAATGFNKALAGSAINTVMSMKPNVLHSGNLSTTAGMLGGQKPFITMTWSNLCRPEDEYELVGMPLHKSGTLSDFSGFTIVSACHLDNILCTDAEAQMIEQALAKGVII